MSIIKIKYPINAIREGTLAIENDCETTETIVECLKYCFPEDDGEIAIKYSKDHFKYFFAYPGCPEEFDCWDETDLPTITASELWKHIEENTDYLKDKWNELFGMIEKPCCNPLPTLQQLQQRIEIIGEQQLDMMHWIEQLENKLEENNCCNNKCKK